MLEVAFYLPNFSQKAFVKLYGLLTPKISGVAKLSEVLSPADLADFRRCIFCFAKIPCSTEQAGFPPLLSLPPLRGMKRMPVSRRLRRFSQNANQAIFLEYVDLKSSYKAHRTSNSI
jgi:hypothetical protein